MGGSGVPFGIWGMRGGIWGPMEGFGVPFEIWGPIGDLEGSHGVLGSHLGFGV